MNNQDAARAVAKVVPDLLNHVPLLPGNLEALRELLQFAFSSGESAGDLRESLASCDVSESDWDSACFAEDLFVDEMIRTCFRVSAERFGGDFRPSQCLPYFRKVLLQPPRSRDSVRFRQEILRELQTEPEIRQRFEAVYRRLAELREELDSPGVMSCEYSTRRRIDLLIRIKETVDAVAEDLGDARSGISRIRAWAKAFQGSEGYAALRDFVDLEGRLSGVQLQFQVGVDGSVRMLEIVGLADNTGNPYYQSPLSRLWGWVRLWWKGARLGRDELVARVVEKVFDAIDRPLTPFLVLIGHMEFYLAALAFHERCEQRGLQTSHPRFVPEDCSRSLRGLFNPLLLAQERAPVCCDFAISRCDAITVITGPNSGGKTRLLQSLGLLQLLGQGGLFVPARQAELWFRSGMFVSLIQNSSADQEEGRLGTELLRIRHLFEQTPRKALIILDELCSGTNPSEGEEIVLLVLSLLRELGPEAFITTHFLRFAEQLAREHSHLGLAFDQVLLDEQQQPTYQFTSGVAQTSLAGQTARRLGVTRDQLQSLVEQKKKPRRELGVRGEVCVPASSQPARGLAGRAESDGVVAELVPHRVDGPPDPGVVAGVKG